jgi:hypothetical protein
MTLRFLALIMLLFLTAYPGVSQSTATSGGASAQSYQDSSKSQTTDSAKSAITGLVLDDHGEPVADAQIIIQSVRVWNQLQFVSTDASGRFKTPKLAPGFYGMEVHWPGYVLRPDGLHPGMHRPGEQLTFHLIKGAVITGRVTDETGAPIVQASVYAYRTRDLEGRRIDRDMDGAMTDDRGVYRIYGLEPGQYIVRVQTGTGVHAGGSETAEETPIYYPSSTRDSAVEIEAHAGEELSGIDIQWRAERGHAISGIVSGESGPIDSVEGVYVKLLNVRSGVIEKIANLYKTSRFALYGLADGEYELYAQKVFGEGEHAGSNPRRVVLRGADLIGIDLKLIQYGSIAGRVKIDPVDPAAPRCDPQTPSRLEEVMLNAQVDSASLRRQERYFISDEYWGSWRGGVADQKGEFTIQNLEAGAYRLNVNLPGEAWYVRSITQQPVNASAKKPEIARSGFTIKSGEKLSGVEVLIAEGAASLRGRAIPAASIKEPPTKNEATPTLRLRIHLLPAEETAAGDLLRYAETIATKDGAFEFNHLAPGKYWLLAKPAPEAESIENPSRPVAWDEAERLKLRREAKASKNEIKLGRCERRKDHTLIN